MQRFFDKVSPEPNSGCWLWCGTVIPDGYGMINTGSRTDGSRRTKLAHRVSWEMHRGPIPDGLLVLHKCDVPGCVNPDHLFLGTNQDNATDKSRKGRSGSYPGMRGNWYGKLTEADVLAIRADGRLHKDIAADYGVTQSNVAQIRRRKTWRHV